MTQHNSEGSFDDSTRRGRDPWMPKRSALPATEPPTLTALLPGYRDFVAIASSDSSEVYRAHQDGLERPVAIKVLRLDDDEAIARFEREITITVQLGRQHPHIVTVIDTGTTTTGRPCIVMEYHDLGSLHDRLRAHGPLAWGEVLSVGTVVADALSFAHRHGVLHRDVKPQNILVLPTSYVVADFGIARPVDAVHTSSVEWFSFRHASPEVLDGLPPAVADDIWSFGSTLFTLLDGQPPFAVEDGSEDTALAYMRRVRTERPRALRRTDVPPGLVAIIDRCLERERADRFPDAVALHAALTALAAETRAWAPLGEAEADEPGIPQSTGHGMVSERPLVVPIRPAPLLPQPPPAPATAQPQPTPDVTNPPPRADGSTAATLPGAVSPSAMAQLVASAVAAGDYATGSDETGTHTGSRYAEPSSVPARPAQTRSPRRILLVTGVAVMIGGVLGIGGTWVAQMARNEAGQAGQVQSPGAGRSPVAPNTPRGTAPSAAPNTENPAIAPVITRVDGRRAGAFIRWRDRSRGEARFAVVQLFADRGGETLRILPPGTTQVAIEGLDPATAPYCFQVIAFVGREHGIERGLSGQRCTKTPQ